jgi:hypothetical protein
MNQDVTRSILWNIPIGFILLLIFDADSADGSIHLCCCSMVSNDTGGDAGSTSPVDQPWRRFFLAFRDGVGQGYLRRETWGWMR